MRLSQDKNPIILGLILVFTGFLLALIVITRINAADLYDLSQDTPFLISSDYDSSVFGYRVGSGSTSWIREEFGLLYANLNDNNNVSSFTDQITYQVTASDSWSDSYAVKRGGFNASNFGIVSGSLLTPENGFIFDSSVEEFHLSKNQWVRVFQCPRQLNYGISQGYYQIYFYDVHQSFMTNSGVDAGRHPVICFCIPQEHYNDFCLLTDDFDYPFQDYKVFYYDYSLGGGQWVGILPNPFSFEDTYTLAYSDRSVQIRANGNRVKIESMMFADQVPSTPTPSPTSEPLPVTEYRFMYLDGLKYPHLIVFEASNFMEEFSSDTSSVMISGILEEHQSSYPAIFKGCVSYSSMSNYYYFNFGFTASSVSQYKDYKLSRNSSLRDFDLIESTYSYTLHDFSTSDTYPFLFGLEDSASSNGGSMFLILDSEFPIDVVSSNNDPNENSNYGGTFYSGGYDVKYKSYRIFSGLLGFASGDVVGPTPTPSPSPSPSPTEAPHVIVNFPTGTPTPTPPINIVTSGPVPSWFPPGDPLIPLDPEIQDDVFGNFSGKVSNNAAFGFLGLLMALIPSEAIWFLWFLLFILIVLGIAKVIIHFTGG